MRDLGARRGRRLEDIDAGRDWLTGLCGPDRGGWLLHGRRYALALAPGTRVLRGQHQIYGRCQYVQDGYETARAIHYRHRLSLVGHGWW